MSESGGKTREACDELLGTKKLQTIVNAAVWFTCAAGVQYDYTLSEHAADILSTIFTAGGFITFAAGLIRQHRLQNRTDFESRQLQAEL